MSDWTEKYFDEFYLKYFLENQSEETTRKQVELIEKFARKGDRILDAGCGIGRHSILLGEMGFDVLGVDRSPLYIEKAQTEVKKRNLHNVSFTVSDLRKLKFSEEFDVVISMWSSFGYFDDETNFAVLLNFFKALKRGGRLLIDIENRDYILKYFIKETFREKDGVFILERRKFHPLTSVVTTHRYVVGKNVRKDYIRHIRVYSATEMINLFKQVGFRTKAVFGNYNGEKFGENSKRIVIIGEKY